MSLYRIKVDKVKSLLVTGDFQKALTIVKTFRIGFSKEEKRSIEIAHEVLTGNERFYQALGIDTEKELERTRQLLSDKYL